MGINTSFIIYGPPSSGKMSFIKKQSFYEHALIVDLGAEGLADELLKNPKMIAVLFEEFSLEAQSLKSSSETSHPRGALAGAPANSSDARWIVIDQFHLISRWTSLVLANAHAFNIKLALTSLYEIPELKNSPDFSFQFLKSKNFYSYEGDHLLYEHLRFGFLPDLQNKPTALEKINYLKKYAADLVHIHLFPFLKIHNLVSFQLFLEYLPELNGQLINYTALARKLNIDYKTVQAYFKIIHSFQIGWSLQPSNIQLRAVQNKSSFFYFNDLGILRALKGVLAHELKPLSNDYKTLFHTLVLTELYKLEGFNLSHITTKDRTHIDAVIQSIKFPLNVHFIKIVSETIFSLTDLKPFLALYNDYLKQNAAAQVMFVCPDLTIKASLEKLGLKAFTLYEALTLLKKDIYG